MSSEGPKIRRWRYGSAWNGRKIVKSGDPPWLEVVIKRAGPGRANSGLGQNQAGPKLARFFWVKILTAQPALKTGPVEPNSLFKAKKIRECRAGP